MRTSNVERPTSNIEEHAERPFVRRSTFRVGRSTFAFDSAFRLLPSVLILALCLLPTVYCYATPTQEDVFKSISDNVNESSGGGKLLAVVAGGVAVILLLAVLQQRQQGRVRPKTVEHPGKLLKEVMKTVPLKPAEMKQLKLLVDRKRDPEDGEGDTSTIASPLTLILCPSVLVRAMRNPPPKLDRKVIAQLARKLGAHGQPPPPASGRSR